MHLVITGLNLWNTAFMSAALAGGLLGARWHVTLSLLASVISIMAHSAVFALFIGAAKTLKETVGLYRLPRAYIDRTNRIYFRLFPWATGAAVSTAAAAILGGLADRSPGYRWAHGALALLAYAVNIAAAFPEHRQLRGMHLLLREMAAAVPPDAERAFREGREGEAGGRAPSDPRHRGKALLTLSALGLLTLLGYRYIARAEISDLAMVLLALPLLVLVGLGTYYLSRGARPGTRAGPPI